MSSPTLTRGRGPLSSLAAIAIGLVAASAHAQVGAAPGTLRYSVSPGCPDEGSFRERLVSRLNSPVEAWSGVALFVEATMSATARGALVVTDASGGAVRREVAGATCEEVVSAIALMAAVLLEGRAEPVAPAPARPVQTSQRPSIASTSVGEGFHDEGADSPAVPVRWAAGAHGVVVGGVAPSLAVGVRAIGELGWEGTGFLKPAMRLSFAWTAPTHKVTSVSDTRFSFLSGRVELCPVRLGGPSVAFVPCGSFDVGRIAADVGSGAHARVWLAPGLVARATWSVSRLLDLELEGGLTFPLQRYRFYFEPGPTVYQVPIVGGTGGLGAVLRFP